MIFLTLLIIFLSLYVLVESVSAIADMPSGLIHFCHKIKYVLAFASALAFIFSAVIFYQAYYKFGLWLIFGSVGTLAFFVWPRTVHRLKEFLKSLDEFEVGY
jgi:hypothetical protein